MSQEKLCLNPDHEAEHPTEHSGDPCTTCGGKRLKFEPTDPGLDDLMDPPPQPGPPPALPRELNDEYMLTYLSAGQPISSVYWTYSNNREKALRAARATAAASHVTSMRVFRRPKVAPWEEVDWK